MYLEELVDDMNPSPRILVFWERQTIWIDGNHFEVDYAVFDRQQSTVITVPLVTTLSSDRKRLMSEIAQQIYRSVEEVEDLITTDILGE
jgi:hypothetical protein